MAALNKVMMIGNLGRDPEVRMAGDSKVANFSIAITERYKNRDGQQQEKTEWVNIVFWGRQAEICEKYLRKGYQIYVEGKLETRSWDDKTSGDKKYRTFIRGSFIQMLGTKNQNQNETNNKEFNQQPSQEEDLPF